MSFLNINRDHRRLGSQFSSPDINRGVEEFSRSPGALLLDVRSPQEYGMGHIPGSKNLPLQSLDKAGSVINSKDQPLYLYCRSGARSRQAMGLLKQMGYSHIKDLGGIMSYKGPLEYMQ